MSDLSEITMFVCANCVRPGREMTAAGRDRSVVPDFNLPCRIEQVIVPCSGRLQPEHVLRAFETGSRIVSVVACQEDNCHYVEGSRRCAIRIDYIRSILNEIGLGEDRLRLFYLPGSALEDLSLAAGKSSPANRSGECEARMAGIRDQLVDALRDIPPNPLRMLSPEANMGVSSEAEVVRNEVGGNE